MSKQKEVIEFWGRPSQGTFRKVAVVQDAIVVEPVPSTISGWKEIVKEVTFSQPTSPSTYPTKSAVRQAKTCARDTAAKIDNFPNVDAPEEGRYAMHRTREGHALSIQRCLRALRPVKDTFDALFVTGLSGIAPGAAVAYALKKELLILRKINAEGDTASHGSWLEGEAQWQNDARYMIIDDFVSNGGTLEKLFKALPTNGTLVGAMLYGHPRTKSERNGQPAKIVYLGGHVCYHLVRRGPRSMLFNFIKQEAT